MVRSDSLIEFLEGRFEKAGDLHPADEPRGMCLLASGIVRRNLEERLARASVPTSSVTYISTIEELARNLVRSRLAGRPEVLSRVLLRRLIQEVLVEAAGNGGGHVPSRTRP